ncbi:carbon storage regulator, CsrA [Mariprofundus ferrinatatus]|uniref:Translational regulator CsrA n=1 Tax=Mariprofundus ferrinatatus TaxID=1921087 RepID=A0A2K8L6J7_9PROT|nr:carbon storage regulator CsrA [Mariprofundus ferrinatatus]ATX82955.1 carbon storage regulator, CsrA [Mariprofundus ferrinatatus]
MLILSRMAGETIMIGNDIRIQVLSNKNGQVRIGINAPRSISVKREEIINHEKTEMPDDLPAIETPSSSKQGSEPI